MTGGGGEIPNRARMSFTGLFRYSARFASCALITGPTSMLDGGPTCAIGWATAGVVTVVPCSVAGIGGRHASSAATNEAQACCVAAPIA